MRGSKINSTRYESLRSRYATIEMTDIGEEINSLNEENFFAGLAPQVEAYLDSVGITETPYSVSGSIENVFWRGASEQFASQGTGTMANFAGAVAGKFLFGEAGGAAGAIIGEVTGFAFGGRRCSDRRCNGIGRRQSCWSGSWL
ncbi:hypothetical protein HLH33_11540 [Gluconacetobacter diazotrophicus]|uniref:Uncharacterized protein n=1 Tax=Gluconacetobacter diazotrophicus TaxID=33996 RepID=A0A7W4I631_GLUDI|nr:hypothetical protein [Gluconacetobacter diazotrophicus]MBB2156935.1 hypothetical protein [Gluconacetobacter diazotrophicus]